MDIEMYADKALMSPENLYDYHSLMIDSGGGEHHRFPMNEMGFQCSVASHESASVNFQNQRDGAGEEEDDEDIKAKIASHPSYSKLLDAYIDCQKVGAPLEIVSLLDEMRREKEQDAVISICSIGVDPQLDDFMETYYDILVKLKSDLSRPFDEATSFLTDIQTQLLNICNGIDEVAAGSSYSSSSELIEIDDAETKREDGELKERLLRMYGSHISSLRLQFSNKKKKGKLPKEARQTLLAWWNLHSKWPYPTEVDKIALAESTGLDHKQINNWFINQRKRHWKSPIEIQNVSANFVAQDEP